MTSPGTTSDPAIGSVVGGCRIEGAIGRGGMGVVYLAEQIALGRRVALKLLSPALSHDADFRARFQQEARIAASLDHENVVPIYEAGEADGHLYLVMRHVEGTDLRTLLRRKGRLVPRRAARIVAQVAAALDAAHACGLVHRDIKPANVLIQKGAHERVFLTDFGLTKRMDATDGFTRTGQWLGTPDYVAPEQIEGRPVDARTDVYALGCVLYEALAGRAPYARDADLATLWAHVNEPPPPVTADEAIPRAFEAVLARALAKDPEARYASAGGLGRAALAAAEGRVAAEDDRSVATGEASPVATAAFPAQRAATTPGTRVHAAPPRARTPRPAPLAVPARSSSSASGSERQRRRPVVLAALAALLLAGGALGAILLASGEDDPQGRPRAAAQTDKTSSPRSPDAAGRSSASGSQAGAAPSSGAATSTAPGAESETPTESAGGDATAAPAFDTPPGAYESYAGRAFTLDRPVGWVTEKDTNAENSLPRYRSQWSDATCGCELIVDYIPGYGKRALTNAAEIPGGVKEATTIGRFADAALRTALEGSRHLATYFVAVGEDNYAIRGSAPSAETALAIAQRVATSLAPAGG